MDAVLVSHTHWDREWYRTFQAFRARLVDTIDRVLELLDADPGWRFTLDGQAVVLEDYLEIRPSRREDLVRACGSGRLAVGPWFVQPDSLLPSGESHVRNLLEGRRVAGGIGPVSRVAYTPDSFGHPAQFPQLFAGFGLTAFVYWRGNGSEIDDLPPVYAWVGPDGTRLTACHLGKGYFAASSLPSDPVAAAAELERIGAELAGPGVSRILFMNGADHAPPDPSTAAVARALGEATGWVVRRGTLDEYVEGLVPGGEHHGELIGGRVANLLPGVWSSRLGLKLADRDAEASLVGWAEPWAALGRALGLPDERPSLRLAWRSLLVNQAHDSVGGCSADAVHEQMGARYAAATELAGQTTARILERLAGLPTDRALPWTDELEVAVFNPSPVSRTDVVRLPLDGFPTFRIRADRADIHPLSIDSLFRAGFTVDGSPARVVPSTDPGRFRVLPEQQPWDLEFVVGDVPAFGCRRMRLAPGDAAPDEVDDGRSIAVGDLEVSAAADGTLRLRRGERAWSGLLGVEDLADRGDTYDFDPLPGDLPIGAPTTVTVARRRHAATGIAELVVTRIFELPTALDDDRGARRKETAALRLETTARLAPGVARVDVAVRVDNTVQDHRLRLLFPTGSPVGTFLAATTFDVAERSTAPVDDSRWQHPAPRTFPHQGWVSVNGLTVAAPGLPEAEVTADGTLAVALVRSVGWLARMDLGSRPIPAGPGLATPGAQCSGELTARLSLFTGPPEAAAIRSAELGLRGVPAGPEAVLEQGISLIGLEGAGLVLSAVKPADDGPGIVVRVQNPGSEASAALLRLGFPVASVSAVRLDESAAEFPTIRDGATVRFDVPPHALRTVMLR